MSRTSYTAEFKAKIVLELLQGEKEFGEICAENSLNPNMVRGWKKDFMENAYLAFNESAEKRASRRKETDLKTKNDQMLKTIGQLTLERDFLQGCFRQIGQEPPRVPEYDSKG